MCRVGLFDFEDSESRGINLRLQRAHGAFKLWALTNGKSPGLRSFTRAFMNVQKSFSTSPWSNSKGSDSVLLCKWLYFYTGLMLSSEPQGFEQFLRVARKVLQNIIGMHALWETHGLFLPRPCAQLLYIKIMTVCKGYHMLARMGMEDFKMVGFGVKPKYHGLKHLAWDIRAQLLAGAPMVLSANMCSCESNEDHVGKVCSLARKVSTKTIGQRLLQRYFLKSKALFVRHRKKFGEGSLYTKNVKKKLQKLWLSLWWRGVLGRKSTRGQILERQIWHHRTKTDTLTNYVHPIQTKQNDQQSKKTQWAATNVVLTPRLTIDLQSQTLQHHPESLFPKWHFWRHKFLHVAEISASLDGDIYLWLWIL